MNQKIQFQNYPPVEVEILDPKEKIQSYWAQGVFYEAHGNGMLTYCAEHYKGGTFFDVGANIGNHSLFFASVCEAETVFAYEAVKEIHDVLWNNAWNNDRSISVWWSAVGDIEKMVSMEPSKIPAHQGGAGMAKVVEGNDTPMTTIDQEVSIHGKYGSTKITLIKIDVEGYELKVLEGAKQTLYDFKPDVFVEAATWVEFIEIAGFMFSIGYEPYQRNGIDHAFNHTATYLFKPKS